MRNVYRDGAWATASAGHDDNVCAMASFHHDLVTSPLTGAACRVGVDVRTVRKSSMDPLTAWAQHLSLILVGVVAGSFVGTQLRQVRAQNALSARDFTVVKHRFEVAVGGVMPVLVVGSALSIALVVGLVATTPRGPVVVLPVLALLLGTAVIVVTLRYNAPGQRAGRYLGRGLAAG